MTRPKRRLRRRSVRRTLTAVVGLPTVALLVFASIYSVSSIRELQRLDGYRDSLALTTGVLKTLGALAAEAESPSPATAAATDLALGDLLEVAEATPGLIPPDTLAGLDTIPGELAAARSRVRLTGFARDALVGTLDRAAIRMIDAIGGGVAGLNEDPEESTGDRLIIAMSALQRLHTEQRIVSAHLQGEGPTRREASAAVRNAETALALLRDRSDDTTAAELNRSAGAAVDRARILLGGSNPREPIGVDATAWRAGTERQIETVTRISEDLAAQLAEQLDRSTHRHRVELILLITATLTVSALAVFVAAVLARGMAARIATLEQAAAALRAGDLSGPVEVDGEDEIAAVGAGLKQLHDMLREVETDVRRVTGAVSEFRVPELLDVDRYEGGWSDLAAAVNGAVESHRSLNAQLAAEVQRQQAMRVLGDAALAGVSRGQLYDDAVRLLAAHMRCLRAEVWERLDDSSHAVRRAAAGEPCVEDLRVAPWPPTARDGQRIVIESPRGQDAPLALTVRLDGHHTVPDADLRFIRATAQLLGAALGRLDAEERALAAVLADPTTGLPNGRHLSELVRRLLASAAGRNDVTIIQLMADHFEEVLSHHGRTVADATLLDLSARLANCVAPPDVLGHLGMGRFVIATPQTGDGLESMLDRIREVVELPVEVAGESIHIRPSIGIAEVGRNAPRDPEPALHESEVASYWASERGDVRPVRFDASIGNTVERRARLAEDIRSLVRNPEARGLYVVYHPIMDVRTGRPIGVETLARWRHPTLGTVPPNEFVLAAERTGSITALGHIITRLACRAVPDLPTAGEPLMLGVNASVVELATPGYAERFLAVLDETGVDPARVVVEVTETSVTEENEALVEELTRLRSHGIRVSVDDFGTGYASLGYLTRLPVDSVKIDREFIAGLDTNERHRSVVAAVVTLGHDLGFRVVAEGVERVEELEVLVDLGCDAVQGFLFSTPCTAEDLQSDPEALSRPFEKLRMI